MDWYKKAQTSTLWHISNEKFRKFNPDLSAQGIIWFAKDRQDLLQDLHGASINSKKPIYLYECKIVANKTAGWEEYDKYGIGELRSMGYDTVELDGDVAVIDEKKISIINIERI